MILIIAKHNEPTAILINELLQQQKQNSVLVDLECFPAHDTLAFRHSAKHGSSVVYNQAKGCAIPLEKISSIFWWRPELPKASPDLTDVALVTHIEEASAEVVYGIFDDLDCLHFPCSRHTMRRAKLKLPQLTLAAKLGFHIPETLVTNDPEAFLDFFNAAQTRVITKPAVALPNPIFREVVFGYANLVQPRDLLYFQDVRLCPFIAQHYVEKKVEIRVTVVGPDVFAAEIHSQSTNRTKTDWRHYDDGNTPHFVHQLPEEIEQLCRKLVVAMGLLYGAIDLILTPAGDYFFLEINPAGQFGWIEGMTGLPISQRIVRMLVDHV
ncbi:MAG: hypothetical protein JNM42_00170 [Propionivibrio sp.]|uniref:hypothetical protein n=1 Tax=Propionivibrio sp. TaxID=2212460 RepID=UPI001A3B9466|nr:hypothetical protein [Propionivibrio sp.]MBL8412838.1 hypothetical protein [Propionivibrio sp.]